MFCVFSCLFFLKKPFCTPWQAMRRTFYDYEPVAVPVTTVSIRWMLNPSCAWHHHPPLHLLACIIHLPRQGPPRPPRSWVLIDESSHRFHRQSQKSNWVLKTCWKGQKSGKSLLSCSYECYVHCVLCMWQSKWSDWTGQNIVKHRQQFLDSWFLAGIRFKKFFRICEVAFVQLPGNQNI